jgi:hypothetical protein
MLMLITGSARLDTFKQSGESLAGRTLSWRLHPFTVKELASLNAMSADEALQRLLLRGGFPEPCLAATDTAAQRWRRNYLDGLVRDDILEVSRIHEVRTMRDFIEILRSRVGSPLSLASISRDLSVSPITLKHYLSILEALYIVFPVRPWHRNLGRATLQTPKAYFFDTGLVSGDAGARLENLVACHLLCLVHWRQDALGHSAELHYLRTKDGTEVDFCIGDHHAEAATPEVMIEVKASDAKPHSALRAFSERWPSSEPIQLVSDLSVEQDVRGIKIRRASDWLAQLDA